MSESYPCAFGKYILLKRLAHGGMGEIHLALTGEVGGFEKLCVIKRLRPSRHTESAVRRFLDEAKVVLKLSHGNLVQVFDAGFVGDEIYLAMEYVEGPDLRDILCQCDERKLRIPLEVALYITVQVCRALDYAHGYGDLKLVHRDICPSNVLVSFSGEVKVTDFGLAQSTLKEEHTAPGKVFGRFAYLAPEQARRGEVDQRTDLYGASIILWELLVGRQMRPGPHTDAALALNQARRGKITPPSVHNPRITPEIDAIVVKGLQVDPDRRYATAEEMRRALAKVLVRLNPTFDASGLADVMRQIYGSRIDEARREREQLLSRNYDRWRRSSNQPTTVVSPLDRKPGEEENLSGQVVDGRYRILRLIGEGGMGGVYEAEHVEIGRRVALKILHAIFSSHLETVARFRAEARAATRIGHPNIVEVTDSGTTGDGRVYFVMELLSGVDLARVMAEDRIVPAARALNIALQICRALHAAHEAGIIHRDLKPENIFLTSRDGQKDFVKILDFGIAKNLELNQSDDRLTHPGIAMGTPEYMAPEQAAGKEVDHRIDVYASGALLYEMLTGHLPHEGDNLMQVLSKKASHPPPAPRIFRPDMPEGLEQVLLRALAADPAARFQTMAELADALLPFSGEGSGWDTVHEMPPLTVESGREAAPVGGRPPSGSTGPGSSVPARTAAAHARAATGPGVPTGLEPTLLSPALRGVASQELRAPELPVSEAHDRLGGAMTGGGSGSGAATRSRAAALARKVVPPALREHPWLYGAPAAAGLALLLTLAAVFWPGGRPVGVPAPDARVPLTLKPDARVKRVVVRPSSRPSSRPRPSRRPRLSEDQVQALLEWAKRAADGRRFLSPKGDNVIELLDRIEEGYPEHPGAQQLRRDLCQRLRGLVTRALRGERYTEAERLVQAWMALDPLSQETREPFFKVQVAQGRQALARGRTRMAQQHAEEALKIVPGSPPVVELLGDIAMKRRKWAQAEKVYEELLEASELGKASRRRIAAKLRAVKKKLR